jgi:hypothetical protein
VTGARQSECQVAEVPGDSAVDRLMDEQNPGHRGRW